MNTPPKLHLSSSHSHVGTLSAHYFCMIISFVGRKAVCAIIDRYFCFLQQCRKKKHEMQQNNLFYQRQQCRDSRVKSCPATTWEGNFEFIIFIIHCHSVTLCFAFAYGPFVASFVHVPFARLRSHAIFHEFRPNGISPAFFFRCFSDVNTWMNSDQRERAHARVYSILRITIST